MPTGKKAFAFKYCMSLPLRLYGVLAGISKCGEPNLKLRQCCAFADGLVICRAATHGAVSKVCDPRGCALSATLRVCLRFALRLCPESQDLQLSCVLEASKPDAADSLTK